MPDLPASLARNPQLDQWVKFNTDETSVTVRTGKVELGQGVKTAIAIIAAEELDVDLEKIRIETGNTHTSPNEFMTAGSMSIEDSGSAVRQACAEVRNYLIKLAADKLNLPLQDLQVEDGIIRHTQGNESISYWEIIGDRPLGMTATGEAVSKPHSRYKLVGMLGKSAKRLDLADKMSGEAAFIQDQVRPSCLHARILRPQSLAYQLDKLDSSKVENLPGVVKVVRDGHFVGVIARDEETAVAARAMLNESAVWERKPDYRLPGDLYEFLKNNATVSLPLKDGTPYEVLPGDAIPALLEPDADITFNATYTKPYIKHAAIGPSAARAIYIKKKHRNEQLVIHSHSQGPYILRDAIAQVLRLPADAIEVTHLENAGCYGHNGADDAAMDAALLAMQLPGEEILLKWSREDEHLWEPFSPAMRIDLQASMIDGKIVAWNGDIYSQSHMGRPIPFGSVSNFLAAWEKSDPVKRPEARPGMMPHGGIHRNADPYYETGQKRIIKHLVGDQTIRTSSTRGLGAYANTFAIETFMNELALAANADPLEFRLAHLKDPRAVTVLKAVAEAAGAYQAGVEAEGYACGKGLAFARYKNTKCYAAVAVHLAVNPETLDIILRHAIIAADAGQIIDRDGLANQLEGGLIQSISWTMKEAVSFDENGPVCKDWKRYPILKFTEVPTVEVILFDHPQLPSLGAGEATQGPAPAAISNAIFDAVGIRLRDLPFTPDQLRKTALATP